MSRPPGTTVAVPEGNRDDAVALLADVPLTEDEAEYVEAARAANTLRGYRSDWAEFTTWCAMTGPAALCRCRRRRQRSPDT